MAQPVWITPAGNLGSIPEGVFYEIPLEAVNPDTVTVTSVTTNGTTATFNFATQTSVLFPVGTTVTIVGFLPVEYNGDYTVVLSTTSSITVANSTTTSVTRYGTVTGKLYFQVVAGELPAGIEVDSTSGLMVGVPQAVAVVEGVPTEVTVDITSKFCVRVYTKNALGGVARLADRTFTLTVTTQNEPEFTTPAGQIAQYYDGTQVFDLQIEYTNADPLTVITVAGGSLPPGLNISTSGLISGFIEPNTSVGAPAGFSRDGQGYDQYPFDFSTKSSTVNYSFTLEINDGKTSNLRTFSILVYSRNLLTADDTQITADNTFVTADASPIRTPILLTPQGSIGTVRNDNFFAFKFDGIDLDGDQITYTISLGGTIGFDTAIVSFTPGSYDYPGEAFDQGGFTLPPGLQLDPNSGWLYGYIPDLGITELTYNFAIRVYKTGDPTVISQYYYYSMNIVGAISNEVTWLTPSYLGSIDNGSVSTLYVEAVNVSGIPLQYQLQSGSNSKLPQGLQLLPEGDIAGRVSFDTFALDGGITTFDVTTRNTFNINPPVTSIGTETTFDMVFTFTVNAYSVNGVVSVFKTFQIRVVRKYNEPFDNLYIQAMPPQNDRNLLNSLLQNDDIFPNNLLYRPQDPNFGLATQVKYWHAYGLTAATLDDYVAALDLNHYWKNLVLGEIKTAQAVDDLGNVIYEVVYSQIVDDLVNNSGQSVGKEVTLPYPITDPVSTSVVYPNSLVDMRTQVIDSVGQISNVLPRWMLSKQADGTILGFTPAWVIAYTKPGKSGQIKYNIQTMFGDQLNLVDFDVDRYELDNLLTKNWDRATQQWIPTPATDTTFDVIPGPPTVFDGGSIQFIVPVDMYSNTQIYDKYLVFPKRNILE